MLLARCPQNQFSYTVSFNNQRIGLGINWIEYFEKDYLNFVLSYLMRCSVEIIIRQFIWTGKLCLYRLFHYLITKRSNFLFCSAFYICINVSWNNFLSSCWLYYVNVDITKWIYFKCKRYDSPFIVSHLIIINY